VGRAELRRKGTQHFDQLGCVVDRLSLPGVDDLDMSNDAALDEGLRLET
jgi:hypothetical protein